MKRSLIFFAFIIFFPLLANAIRTDTVYLYNGDRITGEIKYLHGNKLSFKTDRAGTIDIEWPSITKIYSANYFDIMLTTDERIFGSLDYGDTAGVVLIKFGVNIEAKQLSEIVYIDRIKTDFFDRLSGSITFSTSYTKANKNLQINGGFNITYRGEKVVNNLFANAVITSSEHVDQSQRAEAGYNVQLLHSTRIFSVYSIKYEKNSELNINARYLVKAGIGRYLIRKSFQELYAVTGLSANREQTLAEPVTETNNLELLGQFTFHQFRFRNPQLDLFTTVTPYVGLTDFGRFRLDLEVKLLWELFDDFKWNVTLYDNYDSRQAGTGDPINDWSILTGISYTL